MVIAESLFQPCKAAIMPGERANTLFQVGTAAIMYEISNRRVPEKAQKVIEAHADT